MSHTADYSKAEECALLPEESSSYTWYTYSIYCRPVCYLATITTDNNAYRHYVILEETNMWRILRKSLKNNQITKLKCQMFVLKLYLHWPISDAGRGRSLVHSLCFCWYLFIYRWLQSYHTQHIMPCSPALAGRCGNPGDTVFLCRAGCCGDRRWVSVSDDDVT